MKRKVIKHGPSTYVLSLPNKWVKQHKISKGDELEVEQDHNRLTISVGSVQPVNMKELDITPFRNMIPRTIHSLYKKGYDELRLTSESNETFNLIRSSLGKEAIGFELLERKGNCSVIKNVSEGTRAFDQIMRQTFMMLFSMADEGQQAIINKNTEELHNLITLEETNNRFTTICRRHLNTKGRVEYAYVGPLYYIVEMLEKIADVYKYMFTYLSKDKSALDLDSEIVDKYSDVTSLLRDFHNLYYKFNPEGADMMRTKRKQIIDDLHGFAPHLANHQDIMMYHYLMTLTEHTFSMLDPYLVIAL